MGSGWRACVAMAFAVKDGDSLIRDEAGEVIGDLPGPTSGGPLDNFWLESEGYGLPALMARMRFFGSVLIKVDNKYERDPQPRGGRPEEGGRQAARPGEGLRPRSRTEDPGAGERGDRDTEPRPRVRRHLA